MTEPITTSHDAAAVDLRDGLAILRDVVAGDMSTATLVEVALRVAHELERRRDETPHLVWMGDAGGGFRVDVKPGRELMKAIAVEMMNVLDADAGPNYVQWDVKPAGQVHPYRLILVRPGGKSPHELRRDAEAERDRTLRLLAEYADGDEIDAALGREGTSS